MSNSNVSYFWDFEDSTSAESPTLILEVSTGRLIPHWVELDYLSRSGNVSDPLTPDLLPEVGNENYTLLINPSFRLNDGERYIVILRDLRDDNGELIPVSPAFQNILDGVEDTFEEEQRNFYYNERIFNVTSEYNISIDNIQLCWDFTVMSTPMQTSAMIKMRADAFNRIQNNNIEYTIQPENIIDNPPELQPFIARKIVGTISVPWYLNLETPSDLARIVYSDENNLLSDPVYQGNVDVPFEMLIPYTAINSSLVHEFTIWGHGLFQTYETVEIISDSLFSTGLIGLAVNFIGMSEEDALFIAQAISLNMTNLIMIPHRLHQSMINFLYLTKLVFSSQFIADNSVFAFDGFNIMSDNDNYNCYYIGASLGGIYGSVYMALSPDVTRGALLVPGFPFEFLLPRSSDFSEFWTIIESRYPVDVDRIWVLSLIQLLWTQCSPSGYINHLNDPNNLLTLDDTVSNVLIHYNLGDSQVSWLGALNMGRSLNCYMYDSQVREGNETLFGFNFISDDTVIDVTLPENIGACKIQGWFFSHPTIPFVNVPPKLEFNTHFDTQTEGLDAIEQLWFNGKIDNECYGPCIDTSNLNFTNNIVDCVLRAGLPGFLCQVDEYPLVNVTQNECYPAEPPCGFKLFCDCIFNQALIVFYENDINGNPTCQARSKINANILDADNPNPCQPIVLGENNQCATPELQPLNLHVYFDQNAMDRCCNC